MDPKRNTCFDLKRNTCFDWDRHFRQKKLFVFSFLFGVSSIYMLYVCYIAFILMSNYFDKVMNGKFISESISIAAGIFLV